MKGILIFASVISFFALLGQTILGTPASAAASAQFTRLQFQGKAQSPEMYGASYPIISVSATGSGIATEIGQFALIYKEELNQTDLSTVETAQFVGLNGNSLNVTGVGQATVTATSGIYNLIEIYKVTGGTGRFAGARGTITVNRTMDMTNGQTSSTFDGYLLIP